MTSAGQHQIRMEFSSNPREYSEAFFYGNAYAPHRHDTYTFALTTHGVQSFNYRGALRHSRLGDAVIIHPDELHDGQAGTDAGFGYRSICISPAEIQRTLDGRALPFVKAGVSQSTRLKSILQAMMPVAHSPPDDAEFSDALFDLAAELTLLSGEPVSPPSHDYASVQRAKKYIDASVIDGFSLAELETETGQSRWQISRDFRGLLGTSPYRYLIMRRLDRARQLLLDGHGIADTASACSFADQSHFNRHFKKTYGMSPKSWLISLNR